MALPLAAFAVAGSLVASAASLQPPVAGLAAAPAAQQSIGTANMEPDGTIVLRLIARGSGGMRGEGVLRYGVSDPGHQDILAHVGPLKPGETRPVAPWPD